MKYIKCEQCSELIATQGFKKHSFSCHGQGKRKPVEGLMHVWNKGLTKSDPRVAAGAVKVGISLKGRKGHSPTDEHRKILSDTAKKNGLGGVRRSKHIRYKNSILGSTYELKLAISLDKNFILWNTCRRFPYKDLYAKQRTYTPDFYLPEYDVYLDPKNDFLLNNVNPALGFCDRDKIKWVEQQNGIRVIILNKNELTWEEVKKKLAPNP